MPELGWLIQPAAFPWVALAVGLCAGSFLNVVIHRLPKMMELAWRADCAELAGAPAAAAPAAPYNLVVPRSACPACGHRLRWYENVPVASYLALRGRCSSCSATISPRYPLVELLAGAGGAAAAWHFGFGAAAIGAMLFIWSTIALALIDQATGYLPDDITLPLLWAGLLFNAWGVFAPLREAVLGAAAGYLVLWSVNAAFRLVRGIDGMGYGDFKMTAAVGAFVGWKYLFLVVLVSSLVGLVFGAAQMLAARRGWDSMFRFHFGPYIAIAGIAVLFEGPRILEAVPLLRPF